MIAKELIELLMEHPFKGVRFIAFNEEGDKAIYTILGVWETSYEKNEIILEGDKCR